MTCKTITSFLSLLTLTMLSSATNAIVTSTTTSSSTVTQLTDSVGGYQMSYESSEPDISRDGSKVVFISDFDLVPGGNPDNLENLYIMSSNGTGLQQLTSISYDMNYWDYFYEAPTIPYYTSRPQLSADGSVVVFASTNNLTGENEPELFVDPDYPEYSYYIPYYQIFIMNTDGSGLKQLTHGTRGDSRFPHISHDGAVIAFQSTQDLVGENADGTEEIFALKADGSNLIQVTKGTPKPENGANIRSDASRNVSVSGDGSTLAFDSFIDLVPPKNDDRSDEIFVFDLAGYWQDNAAINDLANYTVQITDTDIADPYHIRAEDAFEPSLSYDGTWVAFSACINPNGDGINDPNREILGDNPFLPDVIFIAKRDGTELRQLTFSDDETAYADDSNWENRDDDAHWPQISDDGRRIVFGSRSRVDIVNDANLYEVAMIDLDAPLGPEGKPVVEQLTYNTDTTGPYVLQLSFGSTDGRKLQPSISADAGKIVLRASSDFTGGNPDGYSEIFKIEPFLPPAPEPTQTDEQGEGEEGEHEEDRENNKDNGEESDDENDGESREGNAGAVDVPVINEIPAIETSRDSEEEHERNNNERESEVVEVQHQSSGDDDANNNNNNNNNNRSSNGDNNKGTGGAAAFGISELLFVLLAMSFIARHRRV